MKVCQAYGKIKEIEYCIARLDEKDKDVFNDLVESNKTKETEADFVDALGCAIDYLGEYKKLLENEIQLAEMRI